MKTVSREELESFLTAAQYDFIHMIKYLKALVVIDSNYSVAIDDIYEVAEDIIGYLDSTEVQ